MAECETVTFALTVATVVKDTSRIEVLREVSSLLSTVIMLKWKILL
jgi:hypothetical protein